MLRNIKFGLLIIAASILVSCEEEIDLKLPPNDPELVIEGYLTDLDFYIPEGDLDCAGVLTVPREDILFAAGLASLFPIDSIEQEADYFPYNKVRLTTTADYFSNSAPPAVSGAEVKLFENGELVETLIEDASEAGVYRITHNPDSSGTAMYHLEINALGKFYETTPELYEPVPPLLEVQANYGPNFIGDSCGYFMSISTYETPGLGNNMAWTYYINNEYQADPSDITVVSDENFDGACLFGFDVYGDYLELGDTFVVFQMSTSEGYLDFMTSLETQTANVGNSFDTPPEPITGNLKNVTDGTKAFGYFNVGGISANLVIVPSDSSLIGDCP